MSSSSMLRVGTAPCVGVRIEAPRSSAPLKPLLPRSIYQQRSLGSSLRSTRFSKPGNLLILREAATTELLEKELAAHASSNGNGNGNGNGYHSNGNGNGVYVPSSNGYSNGTANGVVYNGVPSSLGNGVYASSNGNGAYAVATPVAELVAVVTPAKETTAQTAARLEALLPTPAVVTPLPTPPPTPTPTPLGPRKFSAAGTPYKSPGGKWSQFKTYSTFQRTLEIWTFAIQFAVKYFLLSQKWTYGKEGMNKETISARKKVLAVWLREGLVKLGPTFIKVGQQFSTRVDVLSPEFIKELEVLQDNVPPFDSDTAKAILKQNLGQDPEDVFAYFASEPLAAASLGQVHRATLKTGEEVVVKVQRPGLKELFDIDLKNVRALAVWLQKLDPKTDGAARDWVAIYDECSRILYQEIDYRLEGANADRFRENFKDVSWVKVPKVYWDYSTAEVLVLEYTPGIKINDAAKIDEAGLDRTKLARLSVESYLQQILRYGFFHADPHPGNVAVDAVGGGRLIYYDFGMMGSIPGDVKGGLLDLFYGVYNRDAEKCLQALVTMGVYVPSGDKTAVRRTADYFLSAFTERLDSQKKEREIKGVEYSKNFKPQRSKDEAKERRRQIFSMIGEDLLVAANDQPFRFPATFTFVVRSFTVLDGIGKSLDPRFDISEIAAPYARELLLEGSPVQAKLQKEFLRGFANQNRAVSNLFKNPNKIEDIASTMQRLERGELKLRVRALETERALTRVEAWQRVISSALAASTLVNVGTVLSVSAFNMGATICFVFAAMFATTVAKNYFKVVQLEKKEAQLLGTV